MRQHLAALCLLVLLSGASLLAFWKFASGFVSTRVELPHRSSQQDWHHAFNCSLNTSSSSSNSNCSHSPAPQVDRVVVLIADALRVDMMFDHVRSQYRDHQRQGSTEAQPSAQSTAIHVAKMPKTAALLDDAVRKLFLSSATCTTHSIILV